MYLGTLTSLSSEWDIYWPVLCLLLAAGLCITIDLTVRDKVGARLGVFFTALAGIAAAAVMTVSEWQGISGSAEMLSGGAVLDGYGLFLTMTILAGTAICCFSAVDAVDKLHVTAGDFIGLVLVSASGMLLLVTANDLIMLFLSIELMSLGIYVLAGTNRASKLSVEASVKYLIMGAFASGFLLMGMALLYGATGSIELGAIGTQLMSADPLAGAALAPLGIALVLIGFCFKVGAFPFHQWVPDVYTGAPTAVTGFMAVAVKTAAFGALGRVALTVFPESSSIITQNAVTVLWVLAAATMLLGNLIAVVQDNPKRMLAYSSVAHSGYLLMGVLVAMNGDSGGLAAMAFYLLVYTFGTGGAFALLSFVSGEKEVNSKSDLRGLAKRKPLIALLMAIFMLSLAGIPLTGGFLGKYYLFIEVIQSEYYWLAIIAIISSVIGAFYYLGIIVQMFMEDEKGDEPVVSDESWGLLAALSAAAVATLALGILPGGLMEDAREGAQNITRTPAAAPAALTQAAAK